MTQPKLLELAKQGEPQAIAVLMNRSLQPQGLSVKVSREGDRLSVLLQADQTPNRLVMTNFVRNGITNLKLQSVIQTVEIIGQRTGDDQPAWTQELDLAAMDNANGLLDALGTSPSVTEATETDSSLDLGLASTEPVESLGDWEEIPAANDFAFEDAGLLGDDALVFDEEPLSLDAPSASDMDLDFSTLDAGDAGLEVSSSPDLFDLESDTSDQSAFGLDGESSDFNAMDLESPSASIPADDSLSLFADSSNDFNLESSDQSFDTWDTPSDSFEESSDAWDTPSTSFEEAPDLFSEGSNDLGFSSFDGMPSDDFSLESEESTFAVSASDTPDAPFIDSELVAALTEDSYPEEFDSLESNDFGLETMEAEGHSTDSGLGALFGSSSLDGLDMSSEVESGALDWGTGSETERAFDQPESASPESAFGLEDLPFTTTEDFSLSAGMEPVENAESPSSISEEVATLFGEGDTDLNAFESFSSTPNAFMGAEAVADEIAEMSLDNGWEMDPVASESDSSNLFGDTISTDDTLSADVDNLFGESGFGRRSEIDNDSSDLEGTDFDLGISSFDESDRPDESLLFDVNLPNLEATDELTGVETLSDEYLGFETATSEDNPIPEDLDFGMEPSDLSVEDWDSFNALDSSDLSTTGSDEWNIDASLDENAAFEGSESESEGLSNLDLNLSASDISDTSDWSLESETFVSEAGVEETPSVPDSDLDFDAASLDLDLEPKGSLFVDADAEPSFDNNGIVPGTESEGIGLSESLPEGALLGAVAFLGADAFAHHGDDESLESGDRAEAESFADIPDADLDLAMDLDDTAINDFADSSEDLDAEAARFELTSGDLDDGVESASGFVIDAETALPPEFTETAFFDSDLSPMGIDLDSDFAAAIAPDTSASPIVDLTPLTEGREDTEDWVSTQNTLIDEENVLFDIDEEALDNSTFIHHPELDDEIVLTPDIHEEEGNGWDGGSSAIDLNEPEFGEVEVHAPPLTPEEAAAMAIASENQKENAIVPVPPSDSTKSSGNRGLLALISILVGLWLLGLLAVSLFRREPSPTPSVATSSEPNAAGSPATSPEAAPPAPENAFQDGLAKGMAAATLAQTAKSTDDWGLVVSQWQQAIDAFKAVPESSPDYATAQQKIAEYEGNLAIAQQRLASIPPILETPSTAPAVIVSGAVTCPEVPASEGAPQLEFSNVQLSNTRFVGCLTNHTNLPINAVSVVYQQTSPSAPDAAAKKLGRLDVAVIEPGETQPFRSDFTLAADVKDATIQSIVWSSPTMSEPQQAEVQVSAAPQ